MVVTCSVCPKMFPDPSSLVKHMRKHTGEKPYICDTCGKSFTQTNSLKLHTRIHTGEKPFTCEVCAKPFSQKGLLTVHLRRHTGERPYPCHYCPMAFACFGSRKRHMKLHTGEKESVEKTIICPDCPKTFSNKTFFNIHYRVHTGEKPFACTNCPKVFASKGNLEKHLEVHEIGTEKPFLCYLCVKSFSIERYLKQHVQNIHKEVYAVGRPKYHHSALFIENYIKTEVDGNVIENKENACIKVENNDGDVKNIKKELDESSEIVPGINNVLIDATKRQAKESVIKVNPYQIESPKINQYSETKILDTNSDDSQNVVKNKSLIKESLVPQVIDESSQETCRKDIDNYDCHVCDFKKISKDNFSKHMESAHELCEHCGYQSISKNDLHFHVEFEHEESFDPLEVGVRRPENTEKPDIGPDKDFYKAREDLLSDLANGRDDDTVVSPEQYEELSNDNEIVMDVKGYQCDYCPKSFSEHGSLLRHHLHMHKGLKWII